MLDVLLDLNLKALKLISSGACTMLFIMLVASNLKIFTKDYNFNVPNIIGALWLGFWFTVLFFIIDFINYALQQIL